MSRSSPSPLPDHLRTAQGSASTFRALTWNLKIPVQISLAVGPAVSGRQASEGDDGNGRGFSIDIGARGGVAAGMDKYYVSVSLSARSSVQQPRLLANKRLVVQQMQCARYTYLPVILPEIRDNFVKSVLAPDELESLASPTEDWWFEVDSSRDGEDAHGNGEMCKW